mmetsp:Transcript_977/g.2512  ORF Transcript_977/g.2512 Transcript_977/m.2512 type:complete len:109 (+) Transcript_977:226-552(+)
MIRAENLLLLSLVSRQSPDPEYSVATLLLLPGGFHHEELGTGNTKRYRCPHFSRPMRTIKLSNFTLFEPSPPQCSPPGSRKDGDAYDACDACDVVPKCKADETAPGVW